MKNSCKLLTVMATLAAFGAEGLEETDDYYPRLSTANLDREDRLAAVQELEQLLQMGVTLPDRYLKAMQQVLVDDYYTQLWNGPTPKRFAAAQELERLQQQGATLHDDYRAAMQRALVDGYYTRLSAANPNQEERLAAAQELERLQQQGVDLPDHCRAEMQQVLNRQ